MLLVWADHVDKKVKFLILYFILPVYNIYEPRHEKICIRGLRPVKTQTGLLSFRI